MKSTGEFVRKAFLSAQPAMNYYFVPSEATAAAGRAVEQSVARISRTRDELYASARLTIKRDREQAKYLMRSGFIQEFPT
jgi:hypothetical protein